ncbi:hypothetical protein L9F63_008162, partial [Diploptera punctata]
MMPTNPVCIALMLTILATKKVTSFVSHHHASHYDYENVKCHCTQFILLILKYHICSIPLTL